MKNQKLASEMEGIGEKETLLAEKNHVDSFFEVAPDVIGLRTAIVNCYFIGAPGSDTWLLVDTGLPGYTDEIIETAEARFGPGKSPWAIILTHGHFDHVGCVQKLVQHWDVPVYAHPLEMPYLTGKSNYPPPDSTVGGGLMARIAKLYPSSPIDLGLRVRPLPKTGDLPGLIPWSWLFTPGHSPGHISLFREDDRTLIAGDAVITVRQESLTDVMLQRPEVHGPPTYFTPDWKSARLSVQALARLHPRVLATGHGIPMTGHKMEDQLANLAKNFELIAVPAKGRYIAEPAIANEQGVVYVPNEPKSSVPWLPLGLAAAGLAGLMAGFSILRRPKTSFSP